MTNEQKKIALVAVAGGGGLILLLYLLRSGTGAGTATNAGTVAALAPLQLPPGANITYNFPGFIPPEAVAAKIPATIPLCTKLCDQCDDNAAFAGVASYQISPAALNRSYVNFVGKSYVPSGQTSGYPDIFAPISLTWGTALGDILYGG